MTSEEFKNIVIPLSKKLYKFAFYLLKDKEDAQDAIQEIYAKLWSTKEKLEEYNSIEAFAMRMTKNKCTDILRERTRKYAPDIEGIDIPIEEDKTEEVHQENKEKAEFIKKLIEKLPENYREIIQLKDIEGYEYDEISEILGQNANHIRVTLSRARKKIREMINTKSYEYR